MLTFCWLEVSWHCQFIKLAFLSNCHFVNLLLSWCFVKLPFCEQLAFSQFAVLSNCHFVKLSFFELSFCNLLFCQVATFQFVILSSHHHVKLSLRHIVILSTRHFYNLPFHQRTGKFKTLKGARRVMKLFWLGDW